MAQVRLALLYVLEKEIGGWHWSGEDGIYCSKIPFIVKIRLEQFKESRLPIQVNIGIFSIGYFYPMIQQSHWIDVDGK